MKTGHDQLNCQSSSCRVCNKKHNSLLHNDKNYVKNSMTTPVIGTFSEAEVSSTILPTAIVLIADSTGCYQSCRGFIDSGAQSTLITEACAQRLGLKRDHCRIPLNGLNGVTADVTKGKSILQISSHHNANEVHEVTALIVKKDHM